MADDAARQRFALPPHVGSSTALGFLPVVDWRAAGPPVPALSDSAAVEAYLEYPRQWQAVFARDCALFWGQERAPRWPEYVAMPSDMQAVTTDEADEAASYVYEEQDAAAHASIDDASSPPTPGSVYASGLHPADLSCNESGRHQPILPQTPKWIPCPQPKSGASSQPLKSAQAAPAAESTGEPEGASSSANAPAAYHGTAASSQPPTPAQAAPAAESVGEPETASSAGQPPAANASAAASSSGEPPSQTPAQAPAADVSPGASSSGPPPQPPAARAITGDRRRGSGVLRASGKCGGRGGKKNPNVQCAGLAMATREG
ncbi:unnamed protein product, partial [Prorocentrum cordatum]